MISPTRMEPDLRQGKLAGLTRDREAMAEAEPLMSSCTLRLERRSCFFNDFQRLNTTTYCT